jgi:hypothetical protein
MKFIRNDVAFSADGQMDGRVKARAKVCSHCLQFLYQRA